MVSFFSPKVARPPGPRFTVPYVGSTLAYAQDALRFLERCAFEGHGDVAFVQFLHVPMYVLNHPELVEHVLVNQVRRYPKDTLQLDLARPVFGNGLLTSQGDFWLSQRRMMQPAFHRQRIAVYGQQMTELSKQVRDTWRDGEVRDVYRDMTKLTLEVVLRALFGVDGGGEVQEVTPALDGIMDYFAQVSILLLPPWVPSPGRQAYHKAIQRLDRAVLEIIRRRREKGEDRGDLMSLLLHAQDEDGRRMTDAQLRDEVLTLVLAGHETTALTLTFCWHLLAKNPKCEVELHRELDTVLGGREPTMEDLGALPYTEGVVKEALRLYPPAWSLSRQCAEGDELRGWKLPPNSLVLMNPWTMHRDPRFYEEPLAFRPERWQGGAEQKLPKYAFFPFGGGPRLCIGATFAQVEAKLVLATLARRFRLEAVEPGEPELLTSITLRPKHGLRMRLRAR